MGYYSSNGMTPEEIAAEAAEADRETAEAEAERDAAWEAELARMSKDRRYYLRHLAKRRNDSAILRAKNADALPSDFTDEHKEQILKLFEAAVALSQITGLDHEVDHIVPLKPVCWYTGLSGPGGQHIVSNLRVIPRSLNRMRGHRWIFDGGPIDGEEEEIPF